MICELLSKNRGEGDLEHFYGSFEIETANHNNEIRRIAEKTLRYVNLTRETRRMWNIKTNVIQIIRAASAAISTSFVNYMNIPANHNIKAKQNSHTGHRALIRKVLL